MFSVLGLGVVVMLVCLATFFVFVFLMSTPTFFSAFSPAVSPCRALRFLVFPCPALHHRRLGIYQRRMVRFATCTVYL